MFICTRELSPGLETELQTFKSLKVLDLSLYQVTSQNLWSHVPATVTVIHLSESAVLSGKRSDLEKRLLRLEALQLPFSPPPGHTFRSLISLENQNLRELQLSHRWFSVVDDIEAWIRGCCSTSAFPRLTAFELNFYLAPPEFQVTGGLSEALSHFIKMHPKLELLSLPEFSEEMIRALNDLKSLKALTLRLKQYDPAIAELCRSNISSSLTWLDLQVSGVPFHQTEWVGTSVMHHK